MLLGTFHYISRKRSLDYRRTIQNTRVHSVPSHLLIRSEAACSGSRISITAPWASCYVKLFETG